MTLDEKPRVVWQSTTLTQIERAALLGQTPGCIWLTGLPGAGKTTLANALEQRLHRDGYHTYLLDGDNVRHGLCSNLGFAATDRVENVRRVAEVARLMVDAGLIVLVALVSPYRAERRMARELFREGEGDGKFVEVFVDTPLAVCEKRDPKGMYARARRGEIRDFTGIGSPYEMPEHAELRLNTAELSVEQCVERILESLRQAA